MEWVRISIDKNLQKEFIFTEIQHRKTHNLTHGNGKISHAALCKADPLRQFSLVGTLQIKINVAQHLLAAVVVGLVGMLFGIDGL